MPPATAVARKVHGDMPRDKFAWSASDENARKRGERAQKAIVSRAMSGARLRAQSESAPAARANATDRAIRPNPPKAQRSSKGMPANGRKSTLVARAVASQGRQGAAVVRSANAYRSQSVRGSASSLAVAAAPAARAIASTGALAASGSRAALSVLVGGRQQDGRVDGILRGRAYIVAISILLAGLVALNVDLLALNKDINHYVERSTELKRSNSTLVGRVAKLESSERIARRAQRLGLVMPAPEQFRYLKSRPGSDGRRAAANYRPPAAKPEPVAAPVPQAVAPAPVQPVAQPQTQTPVQPQAEAPVTQPAAPPAAGQPAPVQPAPAQTQAMGTQ